MLKKIMINDGDSRSLRHSKILWFSILILFIIGLSMKIIDTSMATWNYNDIISDRDAIPQSAIDNSPAAKAAWESLDNGAKDQLVGVSIGWILIALKMVIYPWALISVGRFISKNQPVGRKELVFTTYKYLVLFIGLLVGEIITIWLTLRNDVSLTPRVVYSFISPGFSVLFAFVLFIYPLIEIRNRKKMFKQ